MNPLLLRSMIALLALAAIGCGKEGSAGAGSGSGSAAPDELIGSTWQLENLAGTAALPTVVATLEFPEPGKVVGRGSCNRFFGSAQISGTTITIGALGATRMACGEAVDHQETEYLRLLQAAERYELDGATLRVFSTGAAAPLSFTRQSASSSLRDPTGVWTVVGHRAPGVSAMSPSEAGAWKGRTLQFGIAEAIAGADTCIAPSYQRRTVSADSLLSTDYRVTPAALGLPASGQQRLVLTEVACDGKPWRALGGLLLQTVDDHAFAVQDGIFFELRRQQ